jgi:phenylalanyl-tRNA synthetase alpha chain
MSNEIHIQKFEQKIQTSKTELKQRLAAASTPEDLEKIRTTWLGRNGTLHELTAIFKAMSAEARKILGPLFQEFKEEANTAITNAKQKLERQEIEQTLAKDSNFDVTAYQPDQARGSLHPLTLLNQKIEDIFISMGYTIARGPEAETEFYNFEALNIPANHPARDMMDTLWLDHPGLLLRTHTSTVQIHAMEQRKPPMAVASVGRVYRYEATDATHDFMFNQVEALVIDNNIALTHLLGTLKTFFNSFFSRSSLEVRFRPGYFPFVEPGLEFDISCPFCTTGCSVCKYSRWMEMGGAGLVHPNVLHCTKIDTQKYSGFAFAVGVSRLAMLTYAIPDVRLLASGSIDFLSQF